MSKENKSASKTAPCQDVPDPAPVYTTAVPPGHSSTLAPTVSEPFNFPTDAPIPPYSAVNGPPRPDGPSSQGDIGSFNQVITIPQVRSDSASPLLQAYAPVLMHRGITCEAWLSFVTAVSAFLSANVSDRAVSHAGDIAKRIAENPKNMGKGLAGHTKTVGRDIAAAAKKGNVIGAAFGAIGGIVSIPIHAATGLVATGMSLPATAIGAVSKRPKTPYQRALAYVVVANDKWLVPRGLQASLVDTREVERACGLYGQQIVARIAKGAAAGGKLEQLDDSLAALEIMAGQDFDTALGDLWLIVRFVETLGQTQGKS